MEFQDQEFGKSVHLANQNRSKGNFINLRLKNAVKFRWNDADISLVSCLRLWKVKG